MSLSRNIKALFSLPSFVAESGARDPNGPSNHNLSVTRRHVASIKEEKGGPARPAYAVRKTKLQTTGHKGPVTPLPSRRRPIHSTHAASLAPGSTRRPASPAAAAAERLRARRRARATAASQDIWSLSLPRRHQSVAVMIPRRVISPARPPPASVAAPGIARPLGPTDYRLLEDRIRNLEARLAVVEAVSHTFHSK